MATSVAWGLVGLLILGFVYEMIARNRDRKRPVQGRLVDVDGCRLHLIDRGTSTPAVVILHGAGDSSYSWLRVIREVSRFTRVIAYDRPGLGSSGPGPKPDAARSVDQLDKLLNATGVSGPYILVGHSLGGLIARLYAIRHPDRVAGMVMVDSSHEFLKDDAKFRQGFAFVAAILKLFRLLSVVGLPRFLGEAFTLIPMYPERSLYRRQVTSEEFEAWRGAFYRNVTHRGGMGEFAAALPLIEEAYRLRSDGAGGPQFGETPMVVLSNPGFGDAWIEMHRELAGRSSRSVHRIADQKGHSIQMTSPDLVVQSIGELVEQERSRIGRL